MPQNFQLIDTKGEKMRVIYDLPIPNAEPHYVQIIKASRLKPLETYPMGTDPATMALSPFYTPAGKERIVRDGKNVTVYMTEIRSHITPDRLELNRGDHVTIHVTNLESARDATHGFAISDYNVNLSMEPGKVDTVEFTADRSGVFPLYCTEFCSALHLEMAGYMIVK
jgi:nitrous-oxide reductase